MSISSLAIVNTTSPERSVAVTVPIAVWFSSMLKVAGDVKAGPVVSLTRTVLFAVAVLPEESVAV